MSPRFSEVMYLTLVRIALPQESKSEEIADTQVVCSLGRLDSLSLSLSALWHTGRAAGALSWPDRNIKRFMCTEKLTVLSAPSQSALPRHAVLVSDTARLRA